MVLSTALVLLCLSRAAALQGVSNLGSLLDSAKQHKVDSAKLNKVDSPKQNKVVHLDAHGEVHAKSTAEHADSHNIHTNGDQKVVLGPQGEFKHEDAENDDFSQELLVIDGVAKSSRRRRGRRRRNDEDSDSSSSSSSCGGDEQQRLYEKAKTKSNCKKVFNCDGKCDAEWYYKCYDESKAAAKELGLANCEKLCQEKFYRCKNAWCCDCNPRGDERNKCRRYRSLLEDVSSTSSESAELQNKSDSLDESLAGKRTC